MKKKIVLYISNIICINSGLFSFDTLHTYFHYPHNFMLNSSLNGSNGRSTGYVVYYMLTSGTNCKVFCALIVVRAGAERVVVAVNDLNEKFTSTVVEVL